MRFVLIGVILMSCAPKETVTAHAERVCGKEWERRGYEDIQFQRGGPAAKSDAAEMIYTATKDGMKHELQCWTLDRKLKWLYQDGEALEL